MCLVFMRDRITTRIVRSCSLSHELRSKLLACGKITREGHRRWCRSPACDTCRKYRAQKVATALADWAETSLATHRLMRLDFTTASFNCPAKLLQEMHRVRLAIRKIYDYRQTLNDRWAEAWQYTAWAPLFVPGEGWSARLQGVVYLGRINEITFSEAFSALPGRRSSRNMTKDTENFQVDDYGRFSIKLTAFPRATIRADVYEHMVRSLSTISGLKEADPEAVATYFNEIDVRGGTKAILCRRGLQAPPSRR